jgi:hypothetical protein
VFFYSSEHELEDQEKFSEQARTSPEMEDEILESLQYKETPIGVFSRFPEVSRDISVPYSTLGRFLIGHDRTRVGVTDGIVFIKFAKNIVQVIIHFNLFCFIDRKRLYIKRE